MKHTITAAVAVAVLFGAPAGAFAQAPPTLQTAVTYAATAPFCHLVAPTQVIEGTQLTLSGANLRGARQVLIGGKSAAFRSLSNGDLVATVPRLSVDQARVDVVAGAGSTRCTQAVAFRVIVPKVIGLYLDEAMQRIEQAGLRVGSIKGSSNVDAQVIGQSPSAGLKVKPKSPVNLTTRYRPVVR